jgi:hypothetical protein
MKIHIVKKWPEMVVKQSFMRDMGPSIKDIGIFWASFDTPLPHVGISKP